MDSGFEGERTYYQRTHDSRRAPRVRAESCGYALAGLVLVLLGVVPGLGVACALVGVVLCVIALTRSMASGRAALMAWIGLIVAPVTIYAGIYLLLMITAKDGPSGTERRSRRRPGFGTATETESLPSEDDERAAKTQASLQCSANLANIREAIRRFELDNGRLPDALSELYPQHLPDLQIFVCPGAGSAVRSPGEIDALGSYCYSRPAAGADPATTRLVYDRSSEHHGGVGCYCLYLDGKVKMVRR